MSQVNVHPQSLAGYSAADLYDKFRPHYPAEAVSKLREAIPADNDVHVVEIGAGTGIFTRDLLNHPGWATSVSEVIAVEPNPEMRRVLARETTYENIKVSAVDGSFENTSAPDGWADIIVMAMAFHWCQDHEGAVREFTRILKPQGTIALIWNMHDTHNVQWVKDLDDIREDDVKKKGGSMHTRDVWGRFFKLPSYIESFEQPIHSEIPFYEAVNTDNAIQRFLTWSSIAVMSPGDQKRAVESAKHIIQTAGGNETDGFAWLDKSEGTFKFPYLGELDIIRKK